MNDGQFSKMPVGDGFPVPQDLEKPLLRKVF